MSKFDSWVDNKIVQNCFIWFVLLLILTVTIQADNRVSTSLFVILLLAPGVYINNLFILPFLRNKLPVFIGFFLLNTIVFTIISVLIINSTIEQELSMFMFMNFFGILLLVFAFASAIKIARDSFTRRQQEKEAELKLLKAQLNPHFLFNTLNNLYGLSVVKSDKLPNLMLKLSDLLRYSLYETKDTFVPLEKEISYLKNYVALEKIRLDNRTEILFENNTNDTSIMIAPMLLIVFVENAFKHLYLSSDKKSRVAISIENKNDELVFECSNTFSNESKHTENDLEKGKSGIGLRNAKKRLSLLYPEMHDLKINATTNEYRVALTLIEKS